MKMMPLLLGCVFSLSAHAATLVPGSANPWLAGMPGGSPAAFGDAAPAQSPILVTEISISAGMALTFSATGSVGYGGGETYDPRGDTGNLANTSFGFISHLALLGLTGEENGISNLNAPLSALVGVFLDNSQPDGSAAPAMLDFGPGGNVTDGIDYLTISPSLKQVFYIGNGLTSDSLPQNVIVPIGATRLYLGTMDGFGWDGNTGEFSVTVSAVPEPETYTMLLAGLGLVAFAVRGTQSKGVDQR